MKRKNDQAAAKEGGALAALNPRDRKLIELVAAGEKIGKAAKEAGFPEKSASSSATRLLKSAKGIAAMAELKAGAVEQAKITLAGVLTEYDLVVKADPRELMEVIRRPCRYCHGQGHKFQWAEWEFEEAQADYQQKMETWNAKSAKERKASKATEPKPPDIGGGFGWDPRVFPHPECPRCFGEGKLESFFKDTRKLSPEASRLFAGVAETRDGMKVITADKQAALRVLATHVGVTTEKHEHGGPGGGPIPLQPMKPISEAEFKARAARAKAAIDADHDDPN